MNFGEALQALKNGETIKRESDGKPYYMVKNDKVNNNIVKVIGFIIDNDGYVAKIKSDDLLADDWQIVE